MATIGRTWHVRYDNDGKPGTAKIKWKVKKNGADVVEGDWKYLVNTTAEEKAERFYQYLLTLGDTVEASKSGPPPPGTPTTTVTFTLKEGNPGGYTDITGIEIDPGTTGETYTTWDDNGPYIMNLVVAPYEAGGPVEPDGEIFLRVGPTNPEVHVDTTAGGKPRPIASINQDIVTTFNSLYSATPYDAILDPDGNVLIAAVPCDAMVTCGSSDGFTGCVFSLNDQ